MICSQAYHYVHNVFIVALKQSKVNERNTDIMKIITIIGAGMMGSAMSFPASDNGYEVHLVGTPLDRSIISRAKDDGYHETLKYDLPENVKCYQFEELNDAVQGAQLIIGGVSSFGIDWFAQNVLPSLDDSVPLLFITKGLKSNENGALIPFPVWLKSLDAGRNKSINAVGGPCISFELAGRQHTEVAFCGSNLNTLKIIKQMLSTSYYHITVTTDIYGIETAVAMKNAYAMGVSLAVGLAQKDADGAPEKYNPQAGLFFQSTKEMSAIIKSAGGGDSAVFFGAGDLYVTVFGGRTRRLGTLFGKGYTYKQASEVLSGVTLESVAITRVVCGALEKSKDMEKYPLLRYLYSLINDEQRTEIPWDSFCG